MVLSISAEYSDEKDILEHGKLRTRHVNLRDVKS